MHQFGRETVDVIKKDIRYKNAIRTGKLLGSIEYQLLCLCNLSFVSK